MEGKPLDYLHPMTSHPRGSHYIIPQLPAFVNTWHQLSLTITMTAMLLGCVRHTLMRLSLPHFLFCLMGITGLEPVTFTMST